MVVKLSIVVTCFNDSKLFYENNADILQDISDRIDLELLVINTFGRNTNIHSKFLELIASSDNIHLFSTKFKSRQGIGRNIGLDECTGEYIWFIDSDDIFVIPNKDVLKKIKADFVSTNYVMRLSKGETKQKTNGSNGLDTESFLFMLSTNRVSNACWPYFYSVRSLKDSNIKFKDVFFEDMIFNAEVLGSHNNSYQHISTCLYDYQYMAGSTSRQKTFSKIRDRWIAVWHVLKVIASYNSLNRRKKTAIIILYFLYHGIWLTIR